MCVRMKKSLNSFLLFFFSFLVFVFFYARTCRLNTLINVVAYIGFLSLNVFVNQFLFLTSLTFLHIFA